MYKRQTLTIVKERKLDLCAGKAVLVPRPELYVVYTNRRETPDTLPLSGLFESAPEDGRVQHMELAVQILRDDGSGGGIDQYVRFCQISDEMRGRHGATLKAVQETPVSYTHLDVYKRQAFPSGFRWEVKQMLEIIANGSNTYPYQKSTLSDLYRLLETYTLDPVFERYGEFVNRTPCWIDGETARKYSGASVIAGNFLSYSHAFYLITDQEELIRSLERLIEKNRASPQYQAARARWLSSDDRPQPDRQ